VGGVLGHFATVISPALWRAVRQYKTLCAYTAAFYSKRLNFCIRHFLNVGCLLIDRTAVRLSRMAAP